MLPCGRAKASEATSIEVSLTVIGREPSSIGPVSLRVRCVEDGEPVAASGTTRVVSPGPGNADPAPAVVEVRAGAPTELREQILRVRTSASANVQCTVEAVDLVSGSVDYLTTQPLRSDGTRPLPVPGRVTAGGFQSSPAVLGQSIMVTLRFTGDLVVGVRSDRVDDVGASSRSVGLQLRCNDSTINETYRLRVGERRLRTGLPAGAVCVVSADQAGVRFEDTSGVATDATVVIMETPAACWDQRVPDTGCRSVITATVSDAPFTDPAAPASPTSTAPTTTIPDQQTATTAAPAPAPTPEAAPEVLAEPNFTG